MFAEIVTCLESFVLLGCLIEVQDAEAVTSQSEFIIYGTEQFYRFHFLCGVLSGQSVPLVQHCM
jgi:hypothetical protein